jgi:hypothetical protein
MPTKKREPGWRSIGRAPADEVAEARLMAHWASQLLGAVADELVRRKSDDSHTNLLWEDESAALIGHQMDRGLRVALLFNPLAVEIRSPIERDTRALELRRRTVDDTRRWLNRELAKMLDRPLEVALRDYEMPNHRVKRGGAFRTAPAAGIAELGDWFNNAEIALGTLARSDERATEMAVWPHHFDLGGIVFLDRDIAPEKARQIGVGMSPGDRHINRPYFYVTPWPIAEHPDLPELERGRWFTESFTGAVLDADELATARNPGDQAAMVDGFLNEALAAGEALIDEAVTNPS